MVVWGLFFFVFPVLVIYLCYRYPIMDKIGAVVICYIVGIIVGNVGILPTAFLKTQETMADLSVITALPLLLLSLNVRGWVKEAGKAILCMGLAVVSVVIVSFAGFMVIRGSMTEAWQLVGMAIGLYTGGTPNLAAIKTALNIDSTLYLTFHTYDVLAGTIFIIFCLTFAQRIFNRFLIPFDRLRLKPGTPTETSQGVETEEINSYRDILQGKVLLGLLVALLLSLACVGVSFLISQMFPKDYTTSIVILGVTTLGIGLSFIPAVRRIRKTFQFGMYIILVFCLTVGAMANLNKFLDIDTRLMSYVMFCVFGSMVVHALFCKLFKIDTDTFLVVSASAICSPPFVPAIADALKNKQVVLSGLTAGILGYAIGNYLGISFAYLVRALF